MGFLNPFLYQRGFKGLTDIIEGNVTPRGCNTTGFPVGKGWDPATGLGSPVSRSVLVMFPSVTLLKTL
jgi:tripeptidyl-peptidase-1